MTAPTLGLTPDCQRQGVDTAEPKFFYGGADGLEPGDAVPTELGPLPAATAVRLSVSVEDARGGAQLHSGSVYEVKPIGDRLGLHRSVAYPCTFPAAEVVHVVERGLHGPAPSGPMPGLFDPMAADAEVAVHEREAPIVGFRKWALCGAPADGLLAVPLQGGHAQPKFQPGVNEALCPYDHEPARLDCAAGCGVPAYYSSEDTALFTPEGMGGEMRINGDAIYAALLGWGRVASDGRCWRAQYAQLVALWVAPESDRQLANALKHEPVDPATDSEWAQRLADRLGVPLVGRFDQLEEANELASAA